MPRPHTSSTLEYTLLAVFVICAVVGLFSYVWPVIEVILGGFQVIGAALAGTK